MSVWHLHEDGWDTHLNGGQLDVLPTGGQAVVQTIKTRLQTWMGEWWLDTSYGMPWLQVVFVKPVEIPKVEGAMKKIILETPGVRRFLEEDGFVATYFASERRMRVDFKVETVFGTEEEAWVEVDG